MKVISKKLIAICGFLYLLNVSSVIYAYEVGTHSEMSNAAYDSSVLSKPDFLKTLSISATDVFDESRADPRPPTFNRGNARGWIREGAVFEDGKYPLSLKPLFHFFDPLNDEGLYFFTSPTWALEDQGKTHLLQNYSYRDARDYLYKALTLPSDAERRKYFGKTFKAVGTTIHRVQNTVPASHIALKNTSPTDKEY